MIVVANIYPFVSGRWQICAAPRLPKKLDKRNVENTSDSNKGTAGRKETKMLSVSSFLPL